MGKEREKPLFLFEASRSGFDLWRHSTPLNRWVLVESFDSAKTALPMLKGIHEEGGQIRFPCHRLAA